MAHFANVEPRSPSQKDGYQPGGPSEKIEAKLANLDAQKTESIWFEAERGIGKIVGNLPRMEI